MESMTSVSTLTSFIRQLLAVQYEADAHELREQLFHSVYRQHGWSSRPIAQLEPSTEVAKILVIGKPHGIGPSLGCAANQKDERLVGIAPRPKGYRSLEERLPRVAPLLKRKRL